MSLYTSETQNNRAILTTPTVTTCKTANNNTIPILSAPSKTVKRETNLCHCEINPRPQKQQLRNSFYPQRLNPTRTTLLNRPLLIFIFFIDQSESHVFILVQYFSWKPLPPNLPLTNYQASALPSYPREEEVRENGELGLGVGAWPNMNMVIQKNSELQLQFQRGLESWVFINVWVKIIFVML